MFVEQLKLSQESGFNSRQMPNGQREIIVHMSVHAQVHKHTQIYTPVHTCMHIYIQSFTYTHIHTHHTHTHAHVIAYMRYSTYLHLYAICLLYIFLQRFHGIVKLINWHYCL